MFSPKPNQPPRRCQWWLLPCLCAVGATAWAAAPSRVLVDRAVAAIEGQVVTLSQLEFETRVRLVGAGATAAAFAPLDDEALASGLTALVDERLATLEADKLDAWPVSQAEVEAAIAEFRARFADEGQFARFLASQEADLSMLGRVLERSLRAQRALEGKLRLRVQVSDADVAAARASRADLKGADPVLVRQRLSRERFEQLVRDDLAAARRAVDVRLLGPFAPGAGAAP